MSATELLSVYRKGVVALGGVIAQTLLVLQQLAGSGLLHGRALAMVQLVCAVLTAVGVVIARNTDTSNPRIGAGEDGGPLLPGPIDGHVDEFAELTASDGTATNHLHDQDDDGHPLPYPHGA